MEIGSPDNVLNRTRPPLTYVRPYCPEILLWYPIRLVFWDVPLKCYAQFSDPAKLQPCLARNSGVCPNLDWVSSFLRKSVDRSTAWDVLISSREQKRVWFQLVDHSESVNSSRTSGQARRPTTSHKYSSYVCRPLSPVEMSLSFHDINSETIFY